MLRKNQKEKEKENQNQQKENVLLQDQNLNQHQNKIKKSSLKNTLYLQKDAHAGGTLHKKKGVLAANQGRIFNSVDTPCTNTAIKRIRRSQWDALVSVTMSLPTLPKDFLATQITATRIVPGALRKGSSVTKRTRILGLMPRRAADVQMARTRTIAKTSRETASTFLAVMSTLNASSRRS